MKTRKPIIALSNRFALILLIAVGSFAPVFGADSASLTPAKEVPIRSEADREFIHRVGMEVRPVYVIPTSRFLKGENLKQTPIDRSLSLHLKYAFQFRPDTPLDRLSGSAYQGVGLSFHTFYNAEELGNPTALYLFQGARIARISPRFSLNYEWNFGLSLGWSPYDWVTNYENAVIGSRVNAYLNTNFYLLYRLSPRFDLTAGVSLSHFSNGNTKLPNGGLNTAGLTVGITGYLDRQEDIDLPPRFSDEPFQRYVSYEAILFGAWRKKGIRINDQPYIIPGTFAVAGFNFAAMYNLGRKVRVGLSLDGVYDSSTNLPYSAENIIWREGIPYLPHSLKPSWTKQWALGLAAQVDYVMPYFTVTVGFGQNILHAGGDMKTFYQKLALKIDMTRRSFLQIGYSLREFRSPNFLMLGLGYRFNTRE
ncbi:MAG: acyloxyacyl hydrolase [Rikenellaceae bacterium]|nr:acyloxyacyl hydrolase [Rikenellaceae bacterium]